EECCCDLPLVCSEVLLFKTAVGGGHGIEIVRPHEVEQSKAKLFAHRRVSLSQAPSSSGVSAGRPWARSKRSRSSCAVLRRWRCAASSSEMMGTTLLTTAAPWRRSSAGQSQRGGGRGRRHCHRRRERRRVAYSAGLSPGCCRATSRARRS